MSTTLRVDLSEEERSHLHTLMHRGRANARTLTRARVLLKLADDWSLGAIRTALEVSEGTIRRVRQRYVAGGVEAVLHDRVQARRRQALTSAQHAHLIAIACSPVPEGHDHWTLRLLAGKAVELGFVARISPETVRQALKKTR
jgi:transposase